ncbi:hypothetical protein ANN_13144 [Periplaneta americana]|uniref:Uncharacterized protein n=1 Tax=Periplaneta americana TaxID=6978 RepID=A0ABQ8TKR5_PERAM|nr:hypothetical protein ANN_13144 [Periplaneta americana]
MFEPANLESKDKYDSRKITEVDFEKRTSTVARSQSFPTGCSSIGTEKNSLRRLDLNPGFQLYVLMLYPLSHTGYHPGVGQNRLSFKFLVGLVDKASARRAENPGSNPGAGEHFLLIAGVFPGPHFRQMLESIELKQSTWQAFRDVHGFLGNKKSANYREQLENLLHTYHNLGDVSEEHGKRFHQDMQTMELRHQEKRDTAMMGDYVWGLIRDNNESDVEKKTKSVKIMLKAHSCMVVSYEEELWPGKVLAVKNNGAVISCIILLKIAAVIETRIRLKALLDDGYSMSQAADRLGIAKTTAKRWARRYLETGWGGGLKDAVDLGVGEFQREERTGHCSKFVSVKLLCLQVNYELPLDSLEAVRRLAITLRLRVLGTIWLLVNKLLQRSKP